MNVDSLNSINLSCKVISKYFSRDPVMDESLSEFKEKKKAVTGPKNPQQTNCRKKRSCKRTKGQKDIRTALKSITCELEKYSNDFKAVCKKSEIKLESEELQVAIALSKSLHQESVSNEGPSTSHTTQDRIKQIRTTLQEYGFKVPEIKTTTNRRGKKLKKNYKLILTPNEQKQQIISDRYSQVLFENIDSSIYEDDSQLNNNFLYYMTTSAPYEILKDNNVFYVLDALDKSVGFGCLLKDWSKIPGRPASPKAVAAEDMNFSVIECSQEQLDVILSGPLKSTKDILKKKILDKPDIVIDTIQCEVNSKNVYSTDQKKSDNKLNTTDLIGKENKINNLSIHTKIVKQICRSISPDLFDDDLSSDMDIIDSDGDTIPCDIHPIIPQEIPADFVTASKNTNDFMDLTECVNNNPSQKRCEISTLSVISTSQQVSQKNYTMKRISNDSEITPCATSLSQLPTKSLSPIDLTQAENDECVNNFQSKRICEIPTLNSVIHVSQESDETKRKSNDFMEITECVTSLSHPQLKSTKLIDLTNISENNVIPRHIKQNIETNDLVQDLTQSSNSNDDLPFVQITNNQQSSLDDTIIVDYKEYSYISTGKKNVNKVMEDDNENTSPSHGEPTSKNDSSLSKLPKKDIVKNNSCNISFFDEFLHNHSDDHEEETISKSKEYSKSDSDLLNTLENNDIDLTQSSDSSINELPEKSNCNHDSQEVTESLEKQVDMSIDYDEIYDNIIKNSDFSASNVASENDECIDHVVKSNTSIKSSETSEVFEIVDEELNYSLNKTNSHSDNFLFGGISILNNLSSIQLRKSSDLENMSPIPRTSLIKSRSESFLPTVDLKEKENEVQEKSMHREHSEPSTPVKQIEKNTHTVKTPKNNELIIKTSNVTPVPDYGSMSTPEVTKELDRYGLKPLKRKRAIQLLTHIYNQTHPIVHQISTDLTSPSKKPKLDYNVSPNKRKAPAKKRIGPNTSPRKILKSPQKAKVLSYDENIYEMTSEVADIRDLGCNEDDWVFQKREKAKVHSCRVPLHIAFHNYVSCRQHLREAILRYEPVHIDIIHKHLVAAGHRYDPKDLLKFLDKKCITVKTTDNNARNNRRS